MLTVDDQGFVRVWDAGIREPAAELAAPAGGTAVALGFTSSGIQVFGIDVDTSTGTAAELTWNARTGQLGAASRCPASRRRPCRPWLACRRWAYRIVCLTASASCHRRRVSRRQFLALRRLGNVPDAGGGGEPGWQGCHLRSRELGHGARLQRAAGCLAAGMAGSLAGLAFGPGPDDLLVMTSTAIYLWQPLTGHKPLEIGQPSVPIDAAVSVNGDVLAVADTGGTVGVWNAATGKPSTRSVRPTITRRRISHRSRCGSRSARTAAWSHRATPTARFSSGIPCPASSSAMPRVSTWPILELSPAQSGPYLLAVDWPQAGTGVNPQGAGAVLNFATGRVIASYASPPPRDDPGAPIVPGEA